MSRSAPTLAGHFDDYEHQRECTILGMWLFLAAEMIFFGGIILGFVEFRHRYPADFAVASNHTKIALGTVNTAVLLTSSLFMALAVQAAKEGKTRSLVGWLVATLALGIAFLAIKFG